jgi:hypothetical protein
VRNRKQQHKQLLGHVVKVLFVMVPVVFTFRIARFPGRTVTGVTRVPWAPGFTMPLPGGCSTNKRAGSTASV